MSIVYPVQVFVHFLPSKFWSSSAQRHDFSTLFTLHPNRASVAPRPQPMYRLLTIRKWRACLCYLGLPVGAVFFSIFRWFGQTNLPFSSAVYHVLVFWCYEHSWNLRPLTRSVMLCWSAVQVVVCGGGTKMTLVQQTISGFLPMAELLSSVPGDEVIAIGAAKEVSLLMQCPFVCYGNGAV